MKLIMSNKSMVMEISMTMTRAYLHEQTSATRCATMDLCTTLGNLAFKIYLNNASLYDTQFRFVGVKINK